jgi:hypothetical protein
MNTKKTILWMVATILTLSVGWLTIYRGQKNPPEPLYIVLPKDPNNPLSKYLFTSAECFNSGWIFVLPDVRPYILHTGVEWFFNYSDRVCWASGDLLGMLFSDTVGYYCCRYEPSRILMIKRKSWAQGTDNHRKRIEEWRNKSNARHQENNPKVDKNIFSNCALTVLHNIVSKEAANITTDGRREENISCHVCNRTKL